MATDIPNNTKFLITSYYGGSVEGVKLQINEPDLTYCLDQNLIGAIQVSKKDAVELAHALLKFAYSGKFIESLE